MCICNDQLLFVVSFDWFYWSKVFGEWSLIGFFWCWKIRYWGLIDLCLFSEVLVFEASILSNLGNVSYLNDLCFMVFSQTDVDVWSQIVALCYMHALIMTLKNNIWFRLMLRSESMLFFLRHLISKTKIYYCCWVMLRVSFHLQLRLLPSTVPFVLFLGFFLF